MTQSEQKYQIVISTCGERAEAEQIARVLVEEGLAACVNIVPNVHSVYRWQGKVASGEEAMLIIKTTRAGYPLLEKKLRTVHSYELPEIVAVPIVEGLDEYLSWLGEQVSV